jgi:hypothetical protein
MAPRGILARVAENEGNQMIEWICISSVWFYGFMFYLYVSKARNDAPTSASGAVENKYLQEIKLTPNVIPPRHKCMLLRDVT